MARTQSSADGFFVAEHSAHAGHAESLVYDFQMPTRSSAHHRVLFMIAAFKLIDGVVLLAVAIGALKFLNKGTAAEMFRWANAIRVDPGNRFFQLLLTRLSILSEKTLRELSLGTFFYSALHFTEGFGLLFRKRWAEYFTIIITGSFIPLEVYEIVRRPTFAKGIVLVLNLAVVAYLAMNLRRNHS
jgi:uncharacterized membrane protein (DUF2068 family)